MIRTTFAAAAALTLGAAALPAAANEVAPEIHNLCLQAADYRGCVEA